MHKQPEQLAQYSLEKTIDIVCALIKSQGENFQIDKLYETLSSVYSKLYRFSTLNCGESECTISPEDSVHDSYIVCLKDGAQVKMLKKYLKRRYNMSPEDYIREFKLPHDYPMVAPAYSKQRRALAMKAKLGHMRSGEKKKIKAA